MNKKSAKFLVMFLVVALIVGILVTFMLSSFSNQTLSIVDFLIIVVIIVLVIVFWYLSAVRNQNIIQSNKRR